MKAIQITVKSEKWSHGDVVKQGCEDTITTTKLKTVVRSAVQSDGRNIAVRREVDELLGAYCLVGKPASLL